MHHLTLEEVATVVGLDPGSMRHRWYRDQNHLPLYVGKTQEWSNSLAPEEIEGRRLVTKSQLRRYLMEQAKYHANLAQRCEISLHRLARLRKSG